MEEINGIHYWKYKAQSSFDTGYGDLNKNVLSKYTKEQFDSLSEEGQKDLIDEVFNIVRERNIFPGVYYYTEKDIIEEIQYCKEKELPSFNGEILDKRPTLGNSMLKFLFPNYFLVKCKEDKNNSLYERWLDDHKLKRAIEFCFKFRPKIKTPLTSNYIYQAFEMIGGNIPTNFLPMKAKMLLEYYLPNGGNYLDFSCGFGGRLLGAMTTKSKINYYGFEPNSETYEHLLELSHFINEALSISVNDDRIKIYKQGSECKLPAEIVGNMDFAFSSPPYFNLEKYSDEETQCYVRFSKLNEWIQNYVEKTIQNLYCALKPGAHYAVNISDFKVGNDNIKFVDEWIKISQNSGFELVKEIPTKIGRSRPNSQSNQQVYIPKIESIYLFKKL